MTTYSPYGEENEPENFIDSSVDPSTVRLRGIETVSSIVSGGVTGALVGGLVGGKGGAKIGAVLGAVGGLTKGGSSSFSDIAGKVTGITSFGTNGKENSTPTQLVNDWRVRISMQPATASLFYGSSPVMKPLIATSGVIFPHTPNIITTHNANYSSVSPTHSNYSSYFYKNSEVPTIGINAEFTAQTISEGQYVAAAIHFFRSCTKMFYGEDSNAGNPPPLVFLDGYGANYFPHVPCVITSFSHTMPSDVDYVRVSGLVASSDIWIPTSSSINITLQPTYSRSKIGSFKLGDYANGSYWSNSGDSGGFI